MISMLQTLRCRSHLLLFSLDLRKESQRSTESENVQSVVRGRILHNDVVVACNLSVILRGRILHNDVVVACNRGLQMVRGRILHNYIRSSLLSFYGKGDF